MKWLGVCMILAAGTALGAEAGNALRRRYQVLGELRMLMGMLKGELQYGAIPLEELFSRLSEQNNGELGRFFRETAKEMKKPGRGSLEEILQKSVEAGLTGCGLSEKEQQQLVRVCVSLGCMEREAQINVLNSYLAVIELEEKASMERLKQKETMYRCLGFMGGLFCAVLLY